jgi:hypothetical protein
MLFDSLTLQKRIFSLPHDTRRVLSTGLNLRDEIGNSDVCFATISGLPSVRIREISQIIMIVFS